MRVLRQKTAVQGTSSNAREDPHWGETVQVHCLWQGICAEGFDENPHVHQTSCDVSTAFWLVGKNVLNV